MNDTPKETNHVQDKDEARQWLADMSACLDEAIRKFNATTTEQEMARWLADPF